ncbi:hypothetical protein P8452_14989 [Trifolium repens]|jgi:DNA repair exonuclease SbcCD ATPase subunit|nr:hypothetical protein P8452_14989 [Trifolium repens]
MVEEQGQKTKTKAVEEQEQKQKWWKNYDINGANRNQTNRGTRNQKEKHKGRKKAHPRRTTTGACRWCGREVQEHHHEPEGYILEQEIWILGKQVGNGCVCWTGERRE